ncbi:pantoate--beta-alanine ligase [Ktedonobacter racemifer]|uniref:pantoate--beta-alanine ligase (AMP-forming) n=1 Tax=Ktedonobacter racemifer DSM 44963 TaxID=485913 RepID=D6TMX1_KTERA|nr:pantoate--beta-alanine ligase [Ktedonobacter racemifer]EFH87121.1 Pantoate--beta-alanine ligase [Ktedonobacter racemifer DSM 44963]
MRIIEEIDEMIETARGWLTRGSVGFIPITNELSMHAGHQALLVTARGHCESTVVCLLRTPLSFDACSDTAMSTHGLEESLRLLTASDVDVVFTPRWEDLFPAAYATYIRLGGSIQEALVPAHCTDNALNEFATALGQLLLIVRPDIAFLGQKDAIQAAIIHKIIHDLHIDVSLRLIPTVREQNGLAMSSHTLLLSLQEREAATLLHNCLLLCKNSIEQGVDDAPTLTQLVRTHIASNEHITLLHLLIGDPETLQARDKVIPGTLLALKARVGKHLVNDNIQWMRDGSWRL